LELFAAVSAGEHFVHRRGEMLRVAHRGAGRQRRVPELAIRNETREFEQTAPHQASRADEVEQRVLREQRPALALPAL
jgi:hypothetical protein